MGRKKIETIINEKIYPFSLSETGKAQLAQNIRKYPYDLLVECIDIGVSQYFQYDENGKLIQNSVSLFLDKLGGIAYNKSRSPIEQEIYHLKNKGNKLYTYWNQAKAEELLQDYVAALKSQGWSDKQIVDDLQGESTRMMNNAHNWTNWSDNMLHWINDIKNWSNNDTTTVEQFGTIIPDSVFINLSTNIQLICKQINASYEANLFDCCAVLMRRLLESLLVLSFQNSNIESEITDKSGNRYVTLDKIIKIAETNPVLALSSNTKKDMYLFKDLGNYSAHKIWYNCTQQDIKPHILKYRVIIEELLYKAGIKK